MDNLNNRAMSSLGLGIASLLLWVNATIGASVATLGLIFGVMGLKSEKRKLAIIGIVLSAIGLFTTIMYANIKSSEQKVCPPVVIEAPAETLAMLTTKPYTNKKAGFSIRSPKGWELDTSGQYGAMVFFFNTKVDKEGDKPFSANLNVNVLTLPETAPLADIVAETKAALPKMFDSYKLIKDKAVIVNGKEAHLFYNQFTSGKTKYRSLQLMAVNGKKAYVSTGTAFASTWKTYEGLFEAIVSTLKF